MDKVVFLDRDGTLNREIQYLYRKEDLEIFPDVPGALRILKQQGYRLVVVTNQAGVARGYYRESDVEELHRYMNELLKAQGAEIDHFFYCPHHPEHGNGAYRTVCHCRKPGTGMLEMAERYYDIDKSRSWMIGDKRIDIECGRNYGVRTALVGTGYGAAERENIRRELGPAAPGADEDKKESIALLPYDLYADCLQEAAKAIIRIDQTQPDGPLEEQRMEAL